MGNRKKIVYLRSKMAHTASDYYGRAFEQLDVDLTQIWFHPHEDIAQLELPDADLLVFVDCGLPKEFPGLENYTCPTAYVSIDSCHKLDIHKAYVDKYDFNHVFVAQKHIVSEFGDKGIWLPLAAEDQVHAYRPEMARDDGMIHRMLFRNFYDIGMCAAPYKHRKQFKKLFDDAGLKTNFYFRKRYGEQATREVARCTIGFNVGAGFTGTKGLDIPMRVFETMANGQSMLLTNRYDNLGYEDLFEDGKHYITFDSEADALEKAQHFAARPEEAIRIARQGQQHVLSAHTYVNRCKTILEKS